MCAIKHQARANPASPTTSGWVSTLRTVRAQGIRGEAHGADVRLPSVVPVGGFHGSMRAMRNLSVVIAGSVLATATVLLSSGCGSTPDKPEAPKVGKHKFSPADYKLDFLEKGKAAERVKPMVAEKITTILNLIEEKLPPALAPTGAAAGPIMFAVNKSKPFIATVVSDAISQKLDENKDAVEPVLQRYNVLDAPELSFDLMEVPKSAAGPTVERANETLKRAYRITRAVRLTRMLLAVAKKDAATLKTSPDPTALGGIGVAALSVTNLTLEAVVDAQRVGPECQALAGEITNTIGSQPLLALDLGGAAAQLTGASAELTAVPADAAGLLSEANDLLALLGEAPAGTAPGAPTAPVAVPVPKKT